MPGDHALLDVKLLRLLDLLYASGSVTRVAEQLGQSQPTVSIWLGRLRRTLGDPLFVRTPEGMLPTPRAEALIGPVRATLESLRQLSAPPPRIDPANAARRVCICNTDGSHNNQMPEMLARIRTEAPGIRLDAAEIDHGIAERLQSGKADLAIGLIPDLDAGFVQTTLFGQDWVCLANATHPRIGATMTQNAYGREGHVGVRSGTGHRLLERAVEEQRITRRIAIEVPGFLGLGAIIGRTDLLATLPRQTGERLAADFGLRLLACPFPIPGFTVKQYWHARVHHEPGHRWLRSVSERLFRARPP